MNRYFQRYWLALLITIAVCFVSLALFVFGFNSAALVVLYTLPVAVGNQLFVIGYSIFKGNLKGASVSIIGLIVPGVFLWLLSFQ